MPHTPIPNIACEWQPLLPAPRAQKGRGAVSHLAHRFEVNTRDAYDDGWGTQDELVAQADEAPPLQTTVTMETAKSLISSNDSPDISFDYSINPYRGCEHGCIYCYARPTHSYLGLSPGLDFETKLVAKHNAAALLRTELARKSYVPKHLSIGSVTDCYQPIERELKLTRSIIEVLLQARQPFGLVTKAATVERDIDLLAQAARSKLAAVYVTITTLDEELARKLEPRAAAPHRRLRTIRTLREAGIPVGVSVSPIIPFLNEDFEQVLAAAADAGASSAFYVVLRLPWEVSPLFREWLHAHYPLREARVMARIQSMRGGKDYKADFATRRVGEGVWADLIRERFTKATQRLGLNRERIALDLSQFDAARLSGQQTLF
jgi:DNA repair photolyase